MGVRCTAYETAVLDRAGTFRSIGEDAIDAASETGGRFLYRNPDFPDRTDDLVEGLYLMSGATEEWSSSYHGYNVFRAELCKAVHGVDPEVIWDDYERWADRPLAPMIHFADNAGFLGPKTCARLASDAEQIGPLTLPTFPDAFEQWTKMFQLAADTGVIDYS